MSNSVTKTYVVLSLSLKAIISGIEIKYPDSNQILSHRIVNLAEGFNNIVFRSAR